MAWFDALAKLMGEGYGVIQLVFCRNFFGLFLVLLLVWRQGGPRCLVTRHPLIHLARAACGLAATFLFFTGLQFMPLAEAFAITFAGPIFIAALSVPLLGERVGPRRWAAILDFGLGHRGELRCWKLTRQSKERRDGHDRDHQRHLQLGR